MSREQIEEMTCENCLHYKACLVNSEYVPSPCRAYEDNAGYRKQSEGEWLQGVNNSKVCSICGKEPLYTASGTAFATTFYRVKSNYCPNCGANMRKEDEGK